MKTKPNTLDKDIDMLQKKQAEQGLSDAEKDVLIDTLLQRNSFLEEQFKLAKQKLFASKNEAYPGQGELFNEAESLESVEADVEPTDESDLTEYQVKRKRRNNRPFADHIEREVVVHDISEDEKVCGCCQGELHCIGQDISEKLEFVPAKTKVIEHHRLKYACRGCETKGTSSTMKQAPAAPSILPKSYATPSLVSQIITSKYQYGLPLYRQEAIFKQLGIHLSRKTMSDWVLKVAVILKPLLYEYWHQLLLAQNTIRADETPVTVVSDDNVKSYMWVYNSGADSPAGNISGDTTPNIVLYDYQPTRKGQCPVDFLQGYQGYLQVDGYAAYQQTHAKLVACLAHMRRKFMEAKKAQGKNSKVGKADWALNHIQKLYRIETHIKSMTVEQRYAIRQEKSVPLLAQFKTWLDTSAASVLPESLLGKAVSYNLNQWDKFIRYCDDGRLDIDNNRSERAIKPFVIGRKAWLVCQTANGANASATLYSVIETAKVNGLVPFDYLMHVLEKCVDPGCSPENLLPWKVKLG